MKYFFKKTIFVFLFLFFIFFLQRWFLLLLEGQWSQYERNDFLKLIKIGFLFDMQSIAYLILPLSISILIASFYKKIYYFFWNYVKFILYFALFFLIADALFFHYFQTHFNVLVFGALEVENFRASWRFFLEKYPVFYIFVFILFCISIIYFFIQKIKTKNLTKVEKKTTIIIYVLIVIVLQIVAMRASFSTFPLEQDDRIISNHSLLNELSTNGIFSLQQTLIDYTKNNFDTNPEKTLQTYGFSSIEEAIQCYMKNPDTTQNWREQIQKKTAINAFLEENPPHVIFLQLEGFSTYYLELQKENFDVLGNLKNHIDQFVIFKNFTSGFQGTFHTFQHLIFGHVNHDLITQNNFKMPASVASVFKEKKYLTQFITGAKLGWNNIYDFLPKQGFDEVMGDQTIKKTLKKVAIDPDWGVFDESFFEFLFEKFKQTKNPQFIYGMSTTHHPNFDVPSDYVPFPLEVHPLVFEKVRSFDAYRKKQFIAFQYMSHHLGIFLDRMKTAGFLDNTIIAFTGDHTLIDAILPQENYLFDRARVPFALYIPEKYKEKKQIDTDRLGSHKDIFPTLFELALSNQSYFLTGQDILAANFEKGQAIYYAQDLLFEKESAYNLEGNFWIKKNNAYVFDYKTDDKNKTCFLRANKAIFDFLIKKELNKN